MRHALVAAFAAALCLVTVAAQAAHPPLPNQKVWDEAIERLSKDPDPKLAANKKLIMEAEYAMAVALRYGGVDEMVKKYFSPNYVQHDPNVPPGRDGFAKWFAAGAMEPDPKPGETRRDVIPPPPSILLADKDTVTLIFEAEMPDPFRPGKTYVYKPIAVFRIADGKLAEHWGGSPKGAPYCRFGMCEPPPAGK